MHESSADSFECFATRDLLEGNNISQARVVGLRAGVGGVWPRWGGGVRRVRVTGFEVVATLLSGIAKALVLDGKIGIGDVPPAKRVGLP